MTIEPPSRVWNAQSPPAERSTAEDAPIVAFDFDGTLTVRDSFNTFLLWRTHPSALIASAFRLLPHVIVYLVRRDRGRFKAAAVRVFLMGVARSTLADDARRFADHIAPCMFRPDAMAAWERHGAEGARRVIVTASPEITVASFAAQLGADRLIGTRLEFDADDLVTGALAGANCRGEEKVRRLREAFGDDVRIAVAYGDTAGDREMLAMADAGFLRGFTAKPGSQRPPSRPDLVQATILDRCSSKSGQDG